VLVYNLEMHIFFAMITVIFMIIGLIAIQKNHLKPYKLWSFLIR